MANRLKVQYVIIMEEKQWNAGRAKIINMFSRQENELIGESYKSEWVQRQRCLPREVLEHPAFWQHELLPLDSVRENGFRNHQWNKLFGEDERWRILKEAGICGVRAPK
jgi:hypothetical protein